MLETLDYTIRIGSTPTFLYFDLYLYSAYAAHFVYQQCCLQPWKQCSLIQHCSVVIAVITSVNKLWKHGSQQKRTCFFYQYKFSLGRQTAMNEQMKVRVMCRKFECRKDIHYKTQTGTSCEKCNSKAFRLGIEPAPSGLLDQCSTTELQKPLPTTWARVQYIYDHIMVRAPVFHVYYIYVVPTCVF